MLKFFKTPFATTGDKSAVPDAADSNGFVSYTQGYGFDYQRNAATDAAAKNIERDKMNQILFDITNALAELQSHGAPDYITSSLNGGSPYAYDLGAIVRYAGSVYLSTASANTALPTDATKWSRLVSMTEFDSVLGYQTFQELPSGLLMLWVSVNNASVASSLTVTHPVRFPNAALCIIPGAESTTNGVSYSFSALTQDNVTFHKNAIADNYSLRYFVVGY